jgi:hypothetical protein
MGRHLVKIRLRRDLVKIAAAQVAVNRGAHATLDESYGAVAHQEIEAGGVSAIEVVRVEGG